MKNTRSNYEIKCACGCGGTLLRYDSRGRERSFLPSHWSRVQPNKRATVRCENCGKSFERPAWHRRRAEHTFCGTACEGKWSSRVGRRKGQNNGHYNTITVRCAGCGMPVSKAKSLIFRRHNKVYCPACIPKVRGRKGFYVGYLSEFSPKLRSQIRKRDGYRCRWCGKHTSEAGTLHVHHIDYDKAHNTPSNLISLCRICHGQTNFALDTWSERLRALVTR